MQKFFISLAGVGVLFVLSFPRTGMAQANGAFSIRGKMNGAYRENITRVPDSLKIADFRSTMFLYAAYRRRQIQNGQWRLSYELRNYRYAQYQRYHRHDHILYASWQNKIYRQLSLHLGNEYHARFHPYSHLRNYRRNIFDAYSTLPGPFEQKLSFGYQNWLKTYPNSDDYQNYVSHRLYARSVHQVDKDTRLGIKLEFQNHKGNLYPGSTVANQMLNQDGNRFVTQLFLEKVIQRKMFSNLNYKFEYDSPDSPDLDQAGEHIGDENTEELLTEDSDFGYLKHQLSLSTLFKINSRFSLMIFYLAQTKDFTYWRIYDMGPKRKDRLFFLSHILKAKLYKDLGIEFQFNYEKNATNLDSHRYHFHSISLGLYYQP